MKEMAGWRPKENSPWEEGSGKAVPALEDKGEEERQKASCAFCVCQGGGHWRLGELSVWEKVKGVAFEISPLGCCNPGRPNDIFQFHLLEGTCF